jgi:hypothetical protein
VRLAEVEQHLADTHFGGIGGFEETSPFYYRIRSSVILIEFDHHPDVFLTNAEPANPRGKDILLDFHHTEYGDPPCDIVFTITKAAAMA